MKKRSRYFIELSRRKRKNLYVRLCNEIRRKAGDYGGLFTSFYIFGDPAGNKIDWSFDFDFLGLQNDTIWRAEMVTAQTEFFSIIDDQALTTACNMLTDEEHEAAPHLTSGPDGVVIFPEWPRYEKFGGLTLHEYSDKLAYETARDNPPVIYEQIKRIPKYYDGIGLQIIVDAPYIDKTMVEETIKRFRETNEQNWQAVNPVPHDKLFNPERPEWKHVKK